MGNSANAGGGVFNHSRSDATFTNCFFSGNVSSGSYGAGAIFNREDVVLTLTICTLVLNPTGDGGVVSNSLNSSATIVNSILWNNVPAEIVNDVDSTTTITYSIVDGGFTGTGNLDVDPLFVNAGAGNLHLPCQGQ